MNNVQDNRSSLTPLAQVRTGPSRAGAAGWRRARLLPGRRLSGTAEAGIEPDWIIGTSIGAINASLIAGNSPQNRLSRLREFWKRMEQNPVWSFRDIFPGFNEKLSYWSTVTNGIPGFFRPNPLAHAGDSYPLGADKPAIIQPRRWRRPSPNSSISTWSINARRG